MVRQRHNKRRNTSFLFQILVREYAKSIIAESKSNQFAVLRLIKEHFSVGTELRKELALYKAILETSEVDKRTAEKIIEEIQAERKKIDSKKLYAEQTKLISKIHSKLNKKVFSNFVPNYKDLASIYQVLSSDLPINKRIMLEGQIIQRLTAKKEELNEGLKPIDQLSYKTFVNKFNEKYSTGLLMEQKELLSRYIVSYTDNGLQLKTFLNEELGRIKDVLSAAPEEEYKEKISEILNIIEGFKKQPIDENLVAQVARLQELVSEFKE